MYIVCILFVYILFLLLPGQPSTITVKMKTPTNFPVDLYYLMDLSGSMLKDLKRLTTLGRKIG